MSDAYYEEAGSDVEDSLPVAAPVNTKLDAPSTRPKNVTDDHFHETHTITMDLHRVCAQNELTEENTRFLIGAQFRTKYTEALIKQGMSREEAEKISSNQRKVIFTGLRIAREQNQHGKIIGLKSPQFKGSHVSGNDTFLHTTLPDTRQPVQLDKDVFNPERVFSVEDYKVVRSATPALIEKTVRDEEFQGIKYTAVMRDSLAHNYLKGNFKRFPKKERQQLQTDVMNPPVGEKWVDITVAMGKQLRDELLSVVNSSLNKAYNIDEIEFQAAAADGTLETPEGTVGTMVGAHMDDHTQVDAGIRKAWGWTIDLSFKPGPQ